MSQRRATPSSIGTNGLVNDGSHAMVVSRKARARCGSSRACRKAPPSRTSTTGMGARLELEPDANGGPMVRRLLAVIPDVCGELPIIADLLPHHEVLPGSPPAVSDLGSNLNVPISRAA